MRHYRYNQKENETILQSILNGINEMTKPASDNPPTYHVQFSDLETININFNDLIKLAKILQYPINLKEKFPLYFYGVDIKIDQSLVDGLIIYELKDKK